MAESDVNRLQHFRHRLRSAGLGALAGPRVGQASDVMPDTEVTPELPALTEASLVMTVLNEAHSVEAFLVSLSRQSLLPTEIVVVDGGSTDGTVQQFANWLPPRGVTLRMKVARGANISAGRNLALQVASFDRILITDAGTVLAPRWVETLCAAMDNDRDIDVASGFFVPGGSTFWERAIASVSTPLEAEIEPSTFLPSSRSVAIRKVAWRDAGGYPEWLDVCEDLVFDLAMKRTGASFRFVPGAIVTWAGRPSLAKFGKQYFKYARGDGRARLWSRRHILRYVAYGTWLMLGILSRRWPGCSIPMVLTFALYVRKFEVRVMRRTPLLGRHTVLAAAVAPIIVITGDVAKMVGYPVGVVNRRRPGRGVPSAQAHHADSEH